MLESAHQLVIAPEASFYTSKIWDVKQLWMAEFQCVACMLEGSQHVQQQLGKQILLGKCNFV